METFHYTLLETPIGTLELVASERGLVLLNFGGSSHLDRKPRFRNVKWVESERHTREYAKQLHEYFAGKRQRFDLPLDLRGTEFQKRCWRALMKIPYGKTCSYGDIARKVGNPKAFRAVGGANNKNPVAIIVPCHRVIAADKTLGGYGGGLRTKEWLLRLEGAEWES